MTKVALKCNTGIPYPPVPESHATWVYHCRQSRCRRLSGIYRLNPKGLRTDELGPHQRILVVDDADALRRLMQIILGDEGYAVITTAVQEDAVVLLREVAFDLVITDSFRPTPQRRIPQYRRGACGRRGHTGGAVLGTPNGARACTGCGIPRPHRQALRYRCTGAAGAGAPDQLTRHQLLPKSPLASAASAVISSATSEKNNQQNNHEDE